MSIVFNNTDFAHTFFGLGGTPGASSFNVQIVPTYTVTLNGTVTNAGDHITGTLSIGGTWDLIATNLDSPTTIVFAIGNTGSYVMFSNDVVTIGSYPFSDTTLGDYQAPCFAAGTRILTRRGEVAVEDLMVGDEVVALARGGLAPVQWIGRRAVDCRAMRDGAALWPLRVRAGAFAPGRPHSDLLLSPDHAVLVENALIPVRYLENGTTIARVPRDEVTYFHVELDGHDLLMAEGLASESYLDTGNRTDFAGVARDPANALADERAARAVWAEQACRPLHVNGPVVAAARARLAARATELGLAPDPDRGLRLLAGGVEHLPVREGDALVFRLEAPVDGARLLSDCFVPSAVFPDNIDRRCLGVPVVRVAIDGEPVALDDARLLRRGWHRPEPGLRWTNGCADLPALRRLEVTLADLPRQPGPLARTA